MKIPKTLLLVILCCLCVQLTYGSLFGSSTKKSSKDEDQLNKAVEFVELTPQKDDVPVIAKENKVEFVDLDDKKTDAASTPAKKSQTTEKKQEKVEFVDLEDKNEQATATNAATVSEKKEDKVEFIDLAEKKPETTGEHVKQDTTAEKKDQSEKVEFIDLNEKKPETTTEKKEDKEEFIDLTDAKPESTAETAKQDTTTTAETKDQTDKVEFIDLNEKKPEAAVIATESSASDKKDEAKVEFVDLDNKPKETTTTTEKPTEAVAKKEETTKVEFVDLDENNKKKEVTATEKKPAAEAAKVDFVDIPSDTEAVLSDSTKSEVQFLDVPEAKAKAAVSATSSDTAKSASSDQDLTSVFTKPKTTDKSDAKPIQQSSDTSNTEPLQMLNTNENQQVKPKDSDSSAVQFMDLADTKATTNPDLKAVFVKPVTTDKSDAKPIQQADTTTATTANSRMLNTDGNQPKAAAAQTDSSVQFMEQPAENVKKEATAPEKKGQTADKVEFVDVDNKPEAVAPAGTKKTATTDKKDETKVEFIDIPVDNKAAEATPATEAKKPVESAAKDDQSKVEFVDLDENNKKKTEVAAAPATAVAEKKPAADAAKVDFVDIPADNTPVASDFTAKPATSNAEPLQMLNTNENQEKPKKTKKTAGDDTADAAKKAAPEEKTTSATTTTTVSGDSSAAAAGDSSQKSVNILITGIGTAVGREVAHQLLESAGAKNLKIYGLVRSEKQTTEISGMSNKITVVSGEVSDALRMNDLVQEVKPDIVYHFAEENEFISYKLSHNYNQPKIIETNFQGTLNILEALKRNSLLQTTKFFYAGSSHEYSDHLDCSSIPETTKLDPANIYGLSKLSSELLVLQYQKNFELQVIVFRCSSIFLASFNLIS
jgi:hypothetical protein